MGFHMKEPVLFCRIGWMKEYAGPQPHDPRPIGGGSYNRKNIGHEVFNFKVINGRVYGFIQVQVGRKRINLERIIPRCEAEDSVDGVLVVFVAVDPEHRGQKVVGWYKNATVYRRHIKVPRWISKKRRQFKVYAEAASRDAVVIPPDERRCEVPVGKGSIGQANVCYLYDERGHGKKMPWVPKVLSWVRRHKDSSAQRPVRRLVSRQINMERCLGRAR